MSETLICVADDVGLRVWLERVLDMEWELECVTSSDLSRVTRLTQATGARVVIIAVDENDATRSLKTFAAVQKACPRVRLVGLSQRISQDLLLDIMRTGARDCLITSQDSDSAVERIRKVWLSAEAESEPYTAYSTQRNITAVLGAAHTVDTRFFSQNFATEVCNQADDANVLAIDTHATDNQTFYYDSLNRLTLKDLINRGDGFDRAFVETALEEYAPGLRLLSGQVTETELDGDAGADLFITITQLASLFDQVIIRIDQSATEEWLKAIGSDLGSIIIVTHQTVDQIQRTQALTKLIKTHVQGNCRVNVGIDGFEKRANLSIPDAEKTAGCDFLFALPLEWRYRLDSINAGVSMSALPYRTAYQKRLSQFVREHQRRKSAPKKKRLFGRVREEA